MVAGHNYRVSADADGESAYKLLTSGHLWGSLALQDKWENRHGVLFAATNEDINKHVEMNLHDNLESWLTRTKRKLSAAKVIVFVNQSPCTKCSDALRQRAWDIAQLPGGGSGHFEFSFVDSKLYAKGEGDNERHNLFASKQKAREYYSDNVNGRNCSPRPWDGLPVWFG